MLFSAAASLVNPCDLSALACRHQAGQGEDAPLPASRRRSMSSLPPPNSTASSSTGDFVNVTMDEVPLSTPQQPEPSAAAGEIEAQPEQQQQPGGQQHHAPGAAVAAAPAQAEGSGGLLGLWGGTTAAAAGSRAGGSPAGAAEHDPLREIEEAAAKYVA